MKSKKPKKSTSPKRKSGKKPARAIHIDAWLAGFKQRVNAASGEAVGACWLTDPQTGDNVCVLMDEQSCKSANGTFVGGPCGG